MAADSDDLETAMGSIGRWHIGVLLFSVPLHMLSAWYKLIFVFLAPPVKFWCIQPALPANWTGKLPTCSVPDAGGNERDCTGWQYDRSVFTNTIVTEWDLVCERSQVANFAQMLFMAGYLLGSLLGGPLSDSYGRKPILVWSCVAELTAGLLTAVSPWFISFLILRFITGMALAASSISSLVLMMEMIGTRWRIEMTTLTIGVPFSIAHSLLAGIGYLLRDWRQMQMAISIPAVLLLSSIWLVPESPRWLLISGQTERAEKIVRKAARVNQTGGDKWNAPANVHQGKQNNTKPSKVSGMFSIFATPVLRKCTLVMFVVWMSGGLVFFGLAQYVGHIGGDIFMNVFFSGLLELPGFSIAPVLLHRCGRKATLMAGQFAIAAACFAILLIPEQWSAAPTLASLLGGFGLFAQTVSIAAYSIFTGELYPTVIRNAGVGASSTVSKIGSMVAPFVATLGVVNKSLPPLVFGVLPLAAGLLVLLLPETRGKGLTETIEEAEEQGNSKKVEPAAIKPVPDRTNIGFVADNI